MMVLAALFLRPVRRRPLRFLVTSLGVAAGVAALVATVAASRAAVASLREGVLEIAGSAILEIGASGGVDADVLGQLAPLARDARIAPVIEEIVLSPQLGDTLRLIGIDPLVDANVRDIELVPEGASTVDPLTADPATAVSALSRTLRGEGAWIPKGLAREIGLATGDRLLLDVRSRRVELEIAGLFETHSAASAFERVVVVDVALADELCDRRGRLDRIELAPREGVSIEALRARAASLLPEGLAVGEPGERAQETGAMVRSLEFNLTALSGISLFVGAVLVAITLATSVVERRTTIALLRSLGASHGQIVRAVLVEAAVIGALGAALGVALGFLGARFTLAGMRATVATVVGTAPLTPIRFEAGWCALALFLGIAASLGASVLPVIEARRTPPIQGLRRERPEFLTPRARGIALLFFALFGALAFGLSRQAPIAGLPIPALLGAAALFFALFAVLGPLVDALGRLGAREHATESGHARASALVLRLASAALSSGRRRAAWAAGAVGVAVALSVSIATLVCSFRSTLIDWTEQGLRADLSVRPVSAHSGVPVGRLDPRLVTLAQDVFGRSCVDPFHTLRAHVDGKRVTLGGGELDVVRRRGGVPFRGGRDSRIVFEEALAQHAALVNEAFSHRFHLGEGDRVELAVRGTTLELRIAGVFYDYGDSQGLVVIDRRDFLGLSPGDGPREIALFLPAGTDVREARGRLIAAIGGRFSVDVLDNAEVKRDVMAVFDRTFAITRALQAVAAAVAVTAVLSVLLALVSERRSDIGVYAALGASRSQVGAIIALQSAAIAAIGALAGAANGIAIGWILVKVVNLQSFGWTLAFLVPWSTLFETSLAVVGACLLAGLWPAIAASRASLRELLREEG